AANALDGHVFTSRGGRPLTRFGIYKIVRRHGAGLDRGGPDPRRVSPHLFRHTAAVHLLESGVEVNVIRGWLGHVSLETTNRYAEITVRMKESAMKLCEPRDDAALLTWRPCETGGKACATTRLPLRRPEYIGGEVAEARVDDDCGDGGRRAEARRNPQRGD